MTEQSRSKVWKSKYRDEIIERIRYKWPPRRISNWLLSCGEEISSRSIERFRKRWIPIGDILSESYIEDKCKNLDIQLEELIEHARAIEVQKQRCSIIFRQEEANNVVFAQGTREMAMLNQMLVDHRRIKEGLKPSLNVQNNQTNQIIELKWLGPNTSIQNNTVRTTSTPGDLSREHGEIQDSSMREKMGKNNSRMQ